MTQKKIAEKSRLPHNMFYIKREKKKKPKQFEFYKYKAILVGGMKKNCTSVGHKVARFALFLFIKSCWASINGP